MIITIYQRDMKSCVKIRLMDYGDTRILMQILAKNNIPFSASGNTKVKGLNKEK